MKTLVAVQVDPVNHRKLVVESINQMYFFAVHFL